MGGKDTFDCAAWCSGELGPPVGAIWPEKKGWFSGARASVIAASWRETMPNTPVMLETNFAAWLKVCL